jgi:ribosome maturation factor RimP
MHRPDTNQQETDRPEADRGEGGPSSALRLEGLILPTLEAMGYALVRLLVSGKHAPLVQVMAERRDGQPMNVDACAEISRALSALLDVEDPVPGAYTLEVSSPGMDRPLVKAADFERFKGRVAKIETRRPQDGGRKRFQGRLAGMSEGGVRLDTPEGPVTIAVDEIARAKLVIDDALLKESLRREANPASRDSKRG